MRRLFSLFMLMLAVPAVTACTTLSNLSGGPVTVADQTQLDEQLGIAVETMYTATARAGAFAFRARIVEPSSDAAVQEPDFCEQVMAGNYEPSDTGGKVSALECRLRYARDATRSAYDAGNSTSYFSAGKEAIRLAKEILALVRG